MITDAILSGFLSNRVLRKGVGYSTSCVRKSPRPNSHSTGAGA